MSDLPEGITLDTEAQRLAGIRILNERLPRKRLIAQGVLRAPDGAVLLCELTYKKDWDLPGGVVDPGESPAHCVVREIDEELGVDVTVRGLVAVNWLPPYRGWDDALLNWLVAGVGNLVGAVVFVATSYWYLFLKDEPDEATSPAGNPAAEAAEPAERG